MDWPWRVSVAPIIIFDSAKTESCQTGHVRDTVMRVPQVVLHYGDVRLLHGSTRKWQRKLAFQDLSLERIAGENRLTIGFSGCHRWLMQIGGSGMFIWYSSQEMVNEDQV